MIQIAVFGGAILMAMGCATSTSLKVGEDDREDFLINGYSLLYELMRDEAKVSQILMIKDAAPPVAKLLEDISKKAKEIVKQIKAWRKEVDVVATDQTELPLAERKTRKEVSDEQTELLLEETNKRFDRDILLTQVEALNYGVALTDLLAEQEISKSRAKQLRSWQKSLKQLRQRTTGMLQYR